MELQQFASLVNGLMRGHCDDLNVVAADRGSPFRAAHNELPESMLSHYHSRGLTPTETAEEIAAGAGV
ncbi:MAG: hypothetical protein ACREXP_00035 [Steroidobacteraceae bacterium]